MAAGLLPMTVSFKTSITGFAQNRTYSLQLPPCPSLTLSAHKLKRRRSIHSCANNGNGQPHRPNSLKDFMEEAKSLGRIRIIVNTGVGVLESVTRLDKLFYHTLEGRGEYANVMDTEDNVDFHLLVDKVKGAKLVQGKSKNNDTFMIRFMDDKGGYAATFLVMWDPQTDGEYDPGQVEVFQNLMQKYGSEVSFD